MNKTPQIDELIVRELSGSLSADESKTLQSWIEMSPDNKKYFLDRQEIWFSSVVAMDDEMFDAKTAYNKFIDRIGTQNGSKRHQSLWLRAAGIAAAVIIVAATSLLSYRRGGSEVVQRFADIVIEAPVGSRTKLFLPDSTLVWLNAGSRLVYSQGFGVTERRVSLWGEGYFEVAHNDKLPMTVISDQLQVRVLGTVFNVRNYSDEEEIVVSLEKGSILATNMFHSDEKYKLHPNQKVTLNRRSHTMLLSDSEAGSLSCWTEGRLFFDEKLLPDIVKTLERSYNVHIRLADESLNSCRFYCRFSRADQTIQEVLDQLVATNRLDYQMENGEIVLLPKR